MSNYNNERLIELEARLAEAEATLRKIADHAIESPSQAAYWARSYFAADSASVCPFQGPGNSGYTPTLCPVCDNKLGRCTLTTADQPNAARKTVWKPYDVFGVTGRLVYEDTGEDVPDQPEAAAK